MGLHGTAVCEVDASVFKALDDSRPVAKAVLDVRSDKRAAPLDTKYLYSSRKRER